MLLFFLLCWVEGKRVWYIDATIFCSDFHPVAAGLGMLCRIREKVICNCFELEQLFKFKSRFKVNANRLWLLYKIIMKNLIIT